MEHLALEIFDLADGKTSITALGSQYANLPEDASITITDTSEIFDSGDVWSHSFTLNIPANLHIFGTSGDIHGSRLHDQIDKRRARLWVDGRPLYLGYLRLSDEVEVDEDGNVDVTFESGQHTFDEMIDGAKANQVPMMNDVVYGVALWRKRWTKVGIKLQAQANFDDKDISGSGEVTLPGQQEWLEKDVDGEIDATQEYPRMVFPKGEFLNMETDATEEMDFLNTDYPYDDEHPYCNVALCYQKSGYEKKNENDELIPDYSSNPEPQRGYEIMPANRVNSAPNFYVIYWLRCLMKHLGIHIDENQMMDVTDLRRLFFVNTKCEYKKRKYIRNGGDVKGMYRFSSAGRLVPEQFCPTEGKNANLRYLGPKKMVNIEKSKLKAKKMTIGEPTWSSAFHPFEVPKIKTVWLKVREAESWTQANKDEYEWRNSYLHEAIATPECFPDVEISEVISALESGFSIRLLFSDDYQRVRIVLLRNIFRSQEVQAIKCDIIGEPTKTENNIRGFRMTYGDSDDTHFYYKGFNDLLPHKAKLWPEKQDDHDYSKWDLNAEYEKVMHKVSAFNVTCYVTPVNGNAYGIKVDKDAKRYEDLHPSLFEYAGFMDAEDGDCTGEDNTIEEISVGFKPAIMNDTNWEEEHSGDSDKQIFALFVGEEMQPRRPNIREDSGDCNDSDYLYDVDGKLYAKDEDGKYVYKDMMADDGIVKPGEFAIASDLYMTAEGLTARIVAQVWGYAGNTQTGESVKAAITWPITDIDIEGHINEGYRLYLQDNFTPNDEGVAPVENHDWGLTLGIMRGSGSDAGVQYSADPDDGEGNDTWDIMAGSSVTAHPDTCDNYGRIFDYTADGQEDEQDVTGRFSLKLRAEKLNPYFDPTKEESDTNRRYLEITEEKLRRRGLCDQFYKEYSFWVRNARIANIPIHMELAQLLAIDKTKRATVGDITGFIRKMQFTVSNKTGLGDVNMEMMYI